MSPILHELGLDRLSTEERRLLAEALWESIAEDEEAAPLTLEQRKELERRLADSIAHPDAVVSWEVVKAKALARARK